MSLPWIKIYCNLPDHPKSTLLGIALKAPRAWTHVLQLWLWAGRVREDGDLSGLPDEIIADKAGWRRNPAAFVAALREVHFIDSDGRLHDWQDEQAAHAEALRRDRERKARAKAERMRAVPVEFPRSVQRNSGGTSAEIPAQEERREEKRKEELSAPVAAAPGPPPAQEPPLVVQDAPGRPKRKEKAKPSPEDETRREYYRAWRERALLVLGLPADTPPGKEAAAYANAYRRWKGPDRITQALDAWDALPGHKRPSNLLASLSDAFIQGAIREIVGPAADRTPALVSVSGEPPHPPDWIEDMDAPGTWHPPTAAPSEFAGGRDGAYRSVMAARARAAGERDLSKFCRAPRLMEATA